VASNPHAHRRLRRCNLSSARHGLDESGGATSTWRGAVQPRRLRQRDLSLARRGDPPLLSVYVCPLCYRWRRCGVVVVDGRVVVWWWRWCRWWGQRQAVGGGARAAVGAAGRAGFFLFSNNPFAES
jgi:hypothetical protein